MMKLSIQDSLSPDSSTSDQSKLNQDLGPNDPNSRKVQTTTDDLTSLIRQVVAEAVGSFILMFSICGIMASMQLMRVESGLLEYAATAALAVVIVVFSMGNISGAHVNPAVSIAFASVGRFPWYKVPLYILAQVSGSALATYAGKLVYALKPELVMTTPFHGSVPAFWVEFLATFISLFLVASLSRDPKSIAHVSGFIIGGAIGLGVLISGPVSGGSMNPARSLGPAIVTWNFENIWIYLVAPTAGAVSGVTLYRALRLEGWSCTSPTTTTTTTSTDR